VVVEELPAEGVDGEAKPEGEGEAKDATAAAEEPEKKKTKKVRCDLYTLLPLPILYGVQQTQGGSYIAHETCNRMSNADGGRNCSQGWLTSARNLWSEGISVKGSGAIDPDLDRWIYARVCGRVRGRDGGGGAREEEDQEGANRCRSR